MLDHIVYYPIIALIDCLDTNTITYGSIVCIAYYRSDDPESSIPNSLCCGAPKQTVPHCYHWYVNLIDVVYTHMYNYIQMMI